MLSLHRCGTFALTDLTLAFCGRGSPRPRHSCSPAFTELLLPRSPVGHDWLCGVGLVSAGRPWRVEFPRRAIAEVYLAQWNFASAGCRVCCRVQNAGSQRPRGIRGRTENKSFACDHYLFIPRAESTEGWWASETLWRKQAIGRSRGVKLDSFLTAVPPRATGRVARTVQTCTKRQLCSVAQTCGFSSYRPPLEHVSHTYRSGKGSGERPKGERSPAGAPSKSNLSQDAAPQDVKGSCCTC